MRRSCSAPRNSFCSSARQGSGANPVVRLTPLSEATARDASQLLAPAGKRFPPCSPSMYRRTRAGPKSSFRPPTLARPPTVIPFWLPLLLCQNPPGTGPSLACTMRLSLLQARPGLAPEHITDLLNVPRRIHAFKIHAALSALFCRISAGSLPPSARWLTRTRLCWQRKKNGKPRPIKMGEFLRSAYAKRLVNLSQVHLHTKTLHMHQWGVNLPGACEALCHWRGTIEPLVLNSTLEPLVAADLDLVNMFGNAEWPHIRAALRTHFPEASSWTEWQHQSNSVTTLPSSCEFSTDRGAEQGDVLGTIQSVLVLGDARESHLVPLGVALPWVMPRVPLGFYAHPSAFTSSAVGTQPVRDTVVVLSPDAGATALGSAFGTRGQINARAWESVRACDELRSAINGVDHAPTELVLTRQCADVSKLMYHMRINGDILDHDLLASFDGQLRASVATSLAGDLPDHSWWQATTGVTVGGLGLRTAVTVALPAFVASRILSRPLVATMVDRLCAAIGAFSPDDHGRVRCSD